MLARKQSAIYGIAKLGHSLLATYGKKIFRNLKEARHFLRSLKLLIVFFILWESDDFLPKKILEACILQRKSSHSYSRASSSGEKGINFEDDDHHDDEIAGSPTALEIECIELHPTLSVQSTLIQNGGFDDVTEIEISRRNDLLSPIYQSFIPSHCIVPHLAAENRDSHPEQSDFFDPFHADWPYWNVRALCEHPKP